MKPITKTILSAFLIFSIAACKKAGLGGDAILSVTLNHHGTIIKNHVGYPDTVFVKFNADELPGTNPSDFDTYFIGEVGENHVHCNGLKKGNYFLFGTGIDSSGPYRVTGGQAIKIKNRDKDGEIAVDLSVTE
jgi:hypothetical protein